MNKIKIGFLGAVISFSLLSCSPKIGESTTSNSTAYNAGINATSNQSSTAAQSSQATGALSTQANTSTTEIKSSQIQSGDSKVATFENSNK